MLVDYKIFSDGSSRGNPGPGGWGAIIISISRVDLDGADVVELGGGESRTTNNKMELMAVAKALGEIWATVKKDTSMTAKISSVDIYTDSSYLINGITKWVHGWKRNGWKTKTKDDVLNKDIWVSIDESINSLGSSKVKWHHVGGHVGIVGNERCDVIATAFADSYIEKTAIKDAENDAEKFSLFSGDIKEYRKVLDGRDILDISHDEELVEAKKSSSSRSNAKAYSYVSKVDGVIQTHKTWQECEKRVRGARGARFKKALSIGEEAEIMASFNN